MTEGSARRCRVRADGNPPEEADVRHDFPPFFVTICCFFEGKWNKFAESFVSLQPKNNKTTRIWQRRHRPEVARPRTRGHQRGRGLAQDRVSALCGIPLSPSHREVAESLLYCNSRRRPALYPQPLDVAVIVPQSEITDPWEQWADIAGDVRKVSTLIEPVLMENHEDSPLYREVMRTGVNV